MAVFKRGDTCYILENNFRVKQAKVVNRRGKFYTIQLIGSCGAIMLPENRLFESDELAELSKKNIKEAVVLHNIKSQ